MSVQDIYRRAILFAAERHGEQKIPGSDVPYIVHVSNACMEIICPNRIGIV
jgi:guanosine-3',5'-bis(diphosphate) 3'-pyrophosphohydrolase